MDTLRQASEAAGRSRPQFYLCGICEHRHSINWNGDCREDDNRFTDEELDYFFDSDGWTDVAMPT